MPISGPLMLKRIALTAITCWPLAVLGAVAARTGELDLMTAVTCPIMRYHPAIIAQAAATVDLLSGGRFTLGLGSGERLNEHITGEGWPGLPERFRG